MTEDTNRRSLPHQASLPGFCQVEAALARLAKAGIEERGAIYTRREVVEFILDLLGYTPDQRLHKARILEPSFGEGDFLLIIIERLLRAWRNTNDRGQNAVDALQGCILAIELHHETYIRTRQKVLDLLQDVGLSLNDCNILVNDWLIQGDFLLIGIAQDFNFVVGNPPYVRQELIPDALITEYRARYRTVFDRSDLYIPFIERSLTLLREGSSLGFICSDRWMKNRYGGPLREMIANGFNLKTYVDMVNTSAFNTDVIAYPAITIIANDKPGKTRVARQPQISQDVLSNLAKKLLADELPRRDGTVKELTNVAVGAAPWILQSFDQLALVRRIEGEFPTIEEAGCNVGIGVATGADKAYIGPIEELDVEPDRKLPLVMTRDILSGRIEWRGMGIVNPFDDEGLVDLQGYPKLKQYLEARKDQLARRHVAKRAPHNWYRTIDRIYPALAKEPKLLIPDIKGEACIVYEAGYLYPHHNLYYITSKEWNLEALRAILLSGVARLFVATYSTRMRGGYMRFQAQYLRRIRLPKWNDVPAVLAQELVKAAEREDVDACNAAVIKLYALNDRERAVFNGHDS